MMKLSIVFMVMVGCWSTTSANDQSSEDKRNHSIAIDNKNTNAENGEKNNFNYLRLPDGQCHNCSTYKCTNHKSNMGGSEWCIMLFPDAIAHCNSDPNCGGYTMTTAEWFHKKYDKNSQVAVHLNKANEKTIDCLLSEWSSYEKQKDTRHTPITYGRSTCENSQQETCDKLTNFNYQFVSNSDATVDGAPYLCKNHPNNLDNKDVHCVLPISDGIKLCNSDEKCEGFLINTDNDWQTKFSSHGMQAVQLFGQGAKYTPSQNWRSFKKQY